MHHHRAKIPVPRLVACLRHYSWHTAAAVKVQDLQKTLELDQPIVSQQLARLRASGIVFTRKEGTTTFYRVTDPEMADLLRVAKRILNRRLVGVQSLLRELGSERRDRRRRARA